MKSLQQNEKKGDITKFLPSFAKNNDISKPELPKGLKKFNKEKVEVNPLMKIIQKETAGFSLSRFWKKK